MAAEPASLVALSTDEARDQLANIFAVTAGIGAIDRIVVLACAINMAMLEVPREHSARVRRAALIVIGDPSLPPEARA